MTSIIVQPAKTAAAQRNYERTVRNPVHLERIASALSEADREALEVLHPHGRVPLWGTSPGEQGQLQSKWERIQTGDIVLFTGQGAVFALARVTRKFESAAAADRLWEQKTTANGHLASWRHMYAFTEPVEVDVSYSAIKDAMGGAAFPYRGFSVVSDNRASLIVSLFEGLDVIPAPAPDLDSPEVAERLFETLNHPGFRSAPIERKDTSIPEKDSPEFKDRAIRMVGDHQHLEQTGNWTALVAVGDKLARRATSCEADVQDEEPGGHEAELRRLRRENAELRRDNEILKSATAFFADELDRLTKS